MPMLVWLMHRTILFPSALAASTYVPYSLDMPSHHEIHHAVLRRDAQAVAMLLAEGTHPNLRDINGYTALMHASSIGEESIVSLLLSAGADMELHAYYTGDTALILACRDGDDLTFRRLLARGANPFRANWQFFSARSYLSGAARALFDSHLRKHVPGWTPEAGPFDHSPVERVESNMLQESLARVASSGEAQIDIDVRMRELQVAASEGWPCVVYGLLRAGVDPNGRADGDNTALMLATVGNFPPIVAMLHAGGGDVNAHNQDGVTAIQLACDAGHVEVARLLVWLGAKIERDACRLRIYGHRSLFPLRWYDVITAMAFLLVSYLSHRAWRSCRTATVQASHSHHTATQAEQVEPRDIRHAKRSNPRRRVRNEEADHARGRLRGSRQESRGVVDARVDEHGTAAATVETAATVNVAASEPQPLIATPSGRVHDTIETPRNLVAPSPLETVLPCVVCMVGPKEAGFLHAGSVHACCCFDCAKQLELRVTGCPICRLPIEAVVKVHSA